LSRGHIGRAIFTLLATLSAVDVFVGWRAVGYFCFCVLLGLTRILYTARATSLSFLVRRHELVAADSSSLILSVIAGACGSSIYFAVTHRLPAAGFVVAALLQLFAARNYGRIETKIGGGRQSFNKLNYRRLFEHLRSPKTRFAMSATATHRFLLGICIASIAVMIDKSFNMQTTGYLAVLGFSAAGSFLGSISAEWISEHFPRRSVTVIAFALASVVVGIASTFAHPRIALGSVLLCAFAFQNLRVRSDATIQANSPATSIGKIFAAYDVLYNTAYISGGVIGIAATSTFSYRAVLTTACVTYFAASMFFAKLNDGKVSKVSVVATHPSGHRSITPTPERQFAN
ncbi:MAG: hypothetical protein ACO29S_07425, partial [Ilumatobacteraceae bacterium]